MHSLLPLIKCHLSNVSKISGKWGGLMGRDYSTLVDTFASMWLFRYHHTLYLLLDKSLLEVFSSLQSSLRFLGQLCAEWPRESPAGEGLVRGVGASESLWRLRETKLPGTDPTHWQTLMQPTQGNVHSLWKENIQTPKMIYELKIR